MKAEFQPDPELRSAPLWIAARTLLVTHGEEFLSRSGKVIETFDEDDIHDLRVASRRLREGLALFSPCFPKQKIKRLMKKAKTLTRMLGEVRNADEAVRFFTGLTDEETRHSRDELDRLLTELRREREEAHLELKKELPAVDWDGLQGELASTLKRPKLYDNTEADPFVGLTVFAAGAIATRLNPVLGLLPKAFTEYDQASQHQLRIAIKKFRYRLEIIAPAMTGGFQQLHDALKGYQDLLGKLHDIDVFREMVRERLEEGPGKEELLRVMAKRRSALYHAFTRMTAAVPIETIGRKAKEAL